MININNKKWRTYNMGVLDNIIVQPVKDNFDIINHNPEAEPVLHFQTERIQHIGFNVILQQKGMIYKEDITDFMRELERGIIYKENNRTFTLTGDIDANIEYISITGNIVNIRVDGYVRDKLNYKRVTINKSTTFKSNYSYAVPIGVEVKNGRLGIPFGIRKGVDVSYEYYGSFESTPNGRVTFMVDRNNANKILPILKPGTSRVTLIEGASSAVLIVPENVEVIG